MVFQKCFVFVSGLGGALVVSACLLSALRLPQAMAAPMGSASLQELLNSREEWLNPCGNTNTDSGGDSYFQDMSATTETDGDADLLSKILIPVSNALADIQTFSREFVSPHFLFKKRAILIVNYWYNL